MTGGSFWVLTPTLANQYYSELIQTLEDYAGSQEFRVLVCNTFRKRELEKYYLEQFSDNRISGIVYTFLPSFRTRRCGCRRAFRSC